MAHFNAQRSDTEQPCYPFSAILGQRAAKHSLMLLAVEPALRGVLLETSSGSTEALLARSFASLLTQSEKRTNDEDVQDRRFNEFVQLPLNITEDRLLGALDLERTIASGTRVISPGLLAQADGRVLCVNDIGLLDSGTVAHLAHAMDSRCVRVERETISTNQSADFLLIGLFNPTDDELPPMLRERVGLIVDSIRESSIEEGVVMIDREFLFENDPFGFIDEFILDEAAIKSTIEAARSRLPRVRVSKNHIRQIALVAMRLGVEGNRADSFALKAACANAALAGRDEVDEDDIVTAIRFVLAPRATTLPSPEQKEKPTDKPTECGDAAEDANQVLDADASGFTDAADELIPPIDARVPNELFRLPRRTQPRNHRSGKRLKSLASSRGRYVRSQIHATREAKVAIDATLRAAAPFQIRRRSGAEDRKSDLASPRIKIEPGDLRYKQFKQRSGVLFIFAVDASGSMAINRMAQAKGALLRVLQQAYLHRDKVALISFRGKGAEVLLAPTGSVELAKRLVDSLPTGGGTPISAGVAKAIELVRLARLKGMSRAVLVLFTDGRANVIAREGQTIDDELRTLAVALESESIDSVVVDTRARHISSGEANAVAQKLGSRYLYLPRADDAMVYLEVTALAKQPVN
jgi:magnesium chelatase subunit D